MCDTDLVWFGDKLLITLVCLRRILNAKQCKTSIPNESCSKQAWRLAWKLAQDDPESAVVFALVSIPFEQQATLKANPTIKSKKHIC